MITFEPLITLSEPHYVTSYTLDGSVFRFEFYYSEREACWYFDLETESGTSLARSVKIISRVDLLGLLTDPLRPQGQLFALPVDATAPDIAGRFDLSADGPIVLAYVGVT
jgi:hypothetical protein